MLRQLTNRGMWSHILTGFALVGFITGVTETAIAATLTLPADQARAVRGSTRGSFNLPAIANRDNKKNFCLGYGNDQESPDHTLVLQQNFSQLTVQVNSRTNDTTLLIQGPDGSIRCGDTTLTDSNWKAGTYQIWVGTPDSGMQRDYTLTVK